MEIDVSKGFELGCYHFDVKDDDVTTTDLRGRSRYGECSLQTSCIRISRDFSERHYHNTFLHELLEAVNEVYCNGKMRHDDITNCANGLSQAFQSIDIVFGVKDGHH